MAFVNMNSKLKHHFRFSHDEWVGVFVSSVIAGIVVSFNDWGSGSVFSLSVGLTNLLVGVILCFIAFMAHHSAQKFSAIRNDAVAYYELSWTAILLSLLLVTISNGALPLLAFTGIYVTDLHNHRLGHFRFKTGASVLGLVALYGCLANFVLAVVSGVLYGYLGIPLLQQFALINLIIAFCNLLPIPPFDGTRVFFHSRLIYAVYFGALLASLIAYAYSLSVYISMAFFVLGALFAFFFWRKIGGES